MKTNYELGLRLEELIHKDLKITQRQFANSIGMNEHYLSDCIAGRKKLTTDRVIQICETYNVSADYVLALV